MTDFGANIFDDPDAARPLPARTLPPPAAEAPAAAAPPRESRSRLPRRPPVAAADAAPAATPRIERDIEREPVELEAAPAAADPEPAAPAHHGRHARFGPASRDEPPAAERRHDERRRSQPAQPPPARQPRRHDREPERTAAPRRPTAPARASGGIALLVDLDALHAQARAQRSELAMHRLARALAGGRQVAQAIAFTTDDSTPPLGFELQPGSGDSTFAERFAAAAERLAQAHGALLLVPATPAVQQLATRLRRAGHRIELASLLPGAARDDVHQLGRECLFVP